LSEKFDKVRGILKKYGNDPHRLVSVLQEVQEEYSYLPHKVMGYIAAALGLTPGAVYGVATFYSHFTLEPKGKHIIRVCDGTACHVKKSEDIIKVIEATLGLDKKKRTSDDGLFTLEVVACIGACGLAPVIMINEAVHGAVTKDRMAELLAEITSKEAESEKGEQ
jgi:NADH-quinone oxidoreductase subunit E